MTYLKPLISSTSDKGISLTPNSFIKITAQAIWKHWRLSHWYSSFQNVFPIVFSPITNIHYHYVNSSTLVLELYSPFDTKYTGFEVQLTKDFAEQLLQFQHPVMLLGTLCKTVMTRLSISLACLPSLLVSMLVGVLCFTAYVYMYVFTAFDLCECVPL